MFYDRQQVNCGSCSTDDIAATVLARIVGIYPCVLRALFISLSVLHKVTAPLSQPQQSFPHRRRRSRPQQRFGSSARWIRRHTTAPRAGGGQGHAGAGQSVHRRWLSCGFFKVFRRRCSGSAAEPQLVSALLHASAALTPLPSLVSPPPVSRNTCAWARTMPSTAS